MGNSQQQKHFKMKKKEECEALVNEESQKCIQKANELLNQIFQDIKKNDPQFESTFQIDNVDILWSNASQYGFENTKTKGNSSLSQLYFAADSYQNRNFFQQKIENQQIILNDNALIKVRELITFLDKSKQELIEYKKEVYKK